MECYCEVYWAIVIRLFKPYSKTHTKLRVLASSIERLKTAYSNSYCYVRVFPRRTSKLVDRRNTKWWYEYNYKV